MDTGIFMVYQSCKCYDKNRCYCNATQILGKIEVFSWFAWNNSILLLPPPPPTPTPQLQCRFGYLCMWRLWADFARKPCHNFDDKMKTIFCANSHFYYCIRCMCSVNTQKSVQKNFGAVSCSAMNENRFNSKAPELWHVCSSYIFFSSFSILSDDECQLTLNLSQLGKIIQSSQNWSMKHCFRMWDISIKAAMNIHCAHILCHTRTQTFKYNL